MNFLAKSIKSPKNEPKTSEILATLSGLKPSKPKRVSKRPPTIPVIPSIILFNPSFIRLVSPVNSPLTKSSNPEKNSPTLSNAFIRLSKAPPGCIM